MKERLLPLVVVLLAAMLGFIVKRRQPDAPTQMAGLILEQIDRQDFLAPDLTWLVAVFTSSTCIACQDVVTKAKVLQSQTVAVQEIDFLVEKGLHKKYRIESVPTTIIADPNGVVKYGVLGPVTATDLWAAMARCDGSVG